MAKVVQGDEGNFTNIKVLGVGNAGGNIVSRISGRVEGVSTVIFNTEAQSLKGMRADEKIHIGEKTTRGRGAGKDPEKGKFAALEDKEKVGEVVRGAHIVFLVAGLGGGTGTGSSPVIAKIAKDSGAIVISLVTRPFGFEGEARAENARLGQEALEKSVDTLIAIPNEKLMQVVDASTPMLEAFQKVDETVYRTISSIADCINRPWALLAVDFGDICAIVENAGRGVVGHGHGKGEGRMEKATRSTIEDPLVEKSEIMRAKNILITITGCPTLATHEVDQTMKIIENRISSTSRVAGVTIDDRLEDEVKVTLLATGIAKGTAEPPRAPVPGARKEKDKEPEKEPEGVLNGLDDDKEEPSLTRNRRLQGFRAEKSGDEDRNL